MKKSKRKSKLKLYRVIKIIIILILLFTSYILGFARGLDNLPSSQNNAYQHINQLNEGSD